jgi:hypothetical protein
VLQVVLVSNPYSQRVTESNISRWRKTARWGNYLVQSCISSDSVTILARKLQACT